MYTDFSSDDKINLSLTERSLNIWGKKIFFQSSCNASSSKLENFINNKEKLVLKMYIDCCFTLKWNECYSINFDTDHFRTKQSETRKRKIT